MRALSERPSSRHVRALVCLAERAPSVTRGRRQSSAFAEPIASIYGRGRGVPVLTGRIVLSGWCVRPMGCGPPAVYRCRDIWYR